MHTSSVTSEHSTLVGGFAQPHRAEADSGAQHGGVPAGLGLIVAQARAFFRFAFGRVYHRTGQPSTQEMTHGFQ
jgi:hypothetical protein